MRYCNAFEKVQSPGSLCLPSKCIPCTNHSSRLVGTGVHIIANRRNMLLYSQFEQVIAIFSRSHYTFILFELCCNLLMEMDFFFDWSVKHLCLQKYIVAIKWEHMWDIYNCQWNCWQLLTFLNIEFWGRTKIGLQNWPDLTI